MVELDPKMVWTEEADFDAEDVDTDGQQESPEPETEEADETVENESEEASEDADESEDDGAEGAGDSRDGTPDGDEPDGDVIEVGGKEYTPEALSEHISELERGSLRQSDYTKKTQELAEQRKSIEANVAFVKALKETDLISSVKDALVESGIKDADKMIDAVLNGDVGEHPDTVALREMQQTLEQIEAEKEAEGELEKETEALAKAKGITSDEAQQVRKLAEELYEQKGTVLDLEDAYDLYLMRKGKVTIKRKQPSVPKTPRQGRGGKPQGDESLKWDASKLFID